MKELTPTQINKARKNVSFADEILKIYHETAPGQGKPAGFIVVEYEYQGKLFRTKLSAHVNGENGRKKSPYFLK